MTTARNRMVTGLALAALTVAGCGGHARHAAKPAPPAVPTAAALPAHPCSPSNYYMQCARPAAPARPPLAASRPLAYGIDFGWSCPNARALGAVFGASYLSTDASKNWTRACVNSYHAQGVATVAVWETSAGRALDGYTAGRQDALRARSMASWLGEPASRPIYFAVDFDTSGNPNAIVPYFQGADSAIGAQHVGAGYGGLATMRVLFGRHLVAYGWQTAAWSGGAWDGRAQIEQYAFGQSLDWNRAIARDYGQWPYTPPAPPIPRDFYGRCSRLDAITYWKLHGGHGHVSPAQHQQAVRIRKWLALNRIGCTRQPHSLPYRYPKRRRALA